MAPFLVIAAFGFLINFIVSLIGFLLWRGSNVATASILNVTDCGYVSSVGGAKRKYCYDVEYTYNNTTVQGVLTEKRSNKEPCKHGVGETLSIRFKDGKTDVISEEEYAARKKSMIISPCAFVGCIALVIILIMISART